MPTESKTANRAAHPQEKALAGLRELQRRQAEGKLLSPVEVEQAWAGAVIKLRNTVLAIPHDLPNGFGNFKPVKLTVSERVWKISHVRGAVRDRFVHYDIDSLCNHPEKFKQMGILTCLIA